ncbi:hypothetical protein NCCP2331_35740 [Sporosarcina sp. NCCP-2331]|nr:hypothetical protein NCCP2331_35740 [Sporosarcina sp. NCCP-2331]GLB57777.1 hypothetical protein NCCP2378_35680 [Sporosarcina sp. NCCP-2378]
MQFCDLLNSVHLEYSISSKNEISLAPHVAAKHYADEWLRGTGLVYTMIHLGALTNIDSIY